ncbi:hypothetical protein [Porphyrobacter sp. ULC335]|uniref:hypothetical protein n=1 Tax=Porphyrobacter sp. ULC335 TaxID=2854260 RepID=UPI00221E6D99|nr:hypothetical protein [Porphyrobacter sp. ULC335]UYV16775.1 hypothetical protein KVF90_05565 [Porphyrobacter sp. ULC335]
MLMPLLLAALALQDAPPVAAPTPPADVIAIEELPIKEAAATRCALAFATVSRWQKAQDPRGAAYPDVEATGGREFFVQVMAKLMDKGLTRENIVMIASKGVDSNDNPEGDARIAAMMPACELMKSSAGL